MKPTFFILVCALALCTLSQSARATRSLSAGQERKSAPVDAISGETMHRILRSDPSNSSDDSGTDNSSDDGSDDGSDNGTDNGDTDSDTETENGSDSDSGSSEDDSGADPSDGGGSDNGNSTAPASKPVQLAPAKAKAAAAAALADVLRTLKKKMVYRAAIGLLGGPAAKVAKQILKGLAKGEKFTLFVPTDSAFKKASKALKGMSSSKIASVFEYHVVEKLLSAAGLIKAPLNTKYPTLTKYPLFKLLPRSPKFVTVGSRDKKSGKIVSFADVTSPNLYLSKQIIVHGIDAVLISA